MKSSKRQLILLLVILVVGLGIRLVIAPNKGFVDDILLFQAWSRSAVVNGLGNIYDSSANAVIDGSEKFVPTPNYLPIYLYFLKFSGVIYQKFYSADFFIDMKTPLTFILKLNGILFDVLTALAIFFLLKKKSNFKIALLSMVAYYLNPGIIYNSSYWGQVDSIHAFFIILSLYFLTQKKFFRSWIFITLAMLMKLQSFIILPIIMLATVKDKGWKKIFGYIGLGLAVFLLVTAPFIVTGNFLHVLRVIFTSAGYSPYISMNAFNIWWPFTGGYLKNVMDTQTFLRIPYFAIGLSLFIGFYGCILWFLTKKRDYQGIFFSAAFASLAFFMLPTEMHERYMYPVLPILAMCLFTDKRLRWVFGVLSVTFMVNLLAVLPFDHTYRFFDLSFYKSIWVVAANVLVLCYFYFLGIKYLKKNELQAPEEKTIDSPANLQ